MQQHLNLNKMNNKKYLLIVESPSKAKTINKYLGDEYQVLASFGHMIDLESTEKFPWGIDLKNNFTPIYGVLEDKKSKLEDIISCAKGVEKILIASDPDREGEAIAWHLAERLKQFNKPIQRILFKEITKKSVLKEINNPKEINEKLFQAQQTRRIIDRIVGYGVSGFLNKNNSGKTSLSAGRVQSIALKLIVDREKEIQEFIPEKYFSIVASLSKDKIPFEAKYFDKVTNKDQADTIVASAKEELIIKDLSQIDKPKYPQPPFDTAALVSSASSALDLSSADTMKAAQSLYEKGLITYMRTDSFRVSEEALKDLLSYLDNNNLSRPKEPYQYAASNASQDAHEAIRPTDVLTAPDKAPILGIEQEVYELIWTRFVASQMSPAVYFSTTVTFETKDKYIFKSYGKVLKEHGWLKIYKNLLDKDEQENDSLLPELLLNEKFKPSKVSCKEKQTKPSSRFSEKTLIQELKKRGIGRPSTYAAIISKIKERNYVSIKKDAFIPTNNGLDVYAKIANKFSFMDYNYTANLETLLDKVESGDTTYINVMNDFYKDFATELWKPIGAKKAEICSKCNASNKVYTKNNLAFLYCENPSCKHKEYYCLVEGVYVAQATLDVSHDKFCASCDAYLVQINGKFGKFWGCSRFPDCKYILKYKEI